MLDRQNKLEDELYRRAKKRVSIKRGFKIHRNVYLVTNVLLTTMLMTIGIFEGEWDDTIMASLLTALSWGIGLGIHGVVAGSQLKSLDVDNEIEREVQYLKRNAGFDFIEEEKNRDMFNGNQYANTNSKENSLEKMKK